MFHPQCRVTYKSEARLKMSSQEADEWTESLSKSLNICIFVVENNTLLKITFKSRHVIQFNEDLIGDNACIYRNIW